MKNTEKRCSKKRCSKRWTLSLLLSLAMLVSLLPVVGITAYAANETTPANFSTDVAAALSLLNTHKTGGAADSTWDAATKTLTLNGVDLQIASGIALTVPDGTTVVLASGTVNTLKSEAGETSIGLYSTGKLTIRGFGSLTASAGSLSDTKNGCGIKSDGDLLIMEATITASAQSISSDSWAYGIGIYSRGEKLVIASGTVTADAPQPAGEYGGAYGLKNEQQNISVTGGTVTVSGSSSACYGLPKTVDGAAIRAGENSSTTNTTLDYNQKWVQITAPVAVFFDARSGETINPQPVSSLQKLPTPASWEGCTFGGWYTGPDGTGTAVDATAAAALTASTNLYAKWVKGTATVRTQRLDLSAAEDAASAEQGWSWDSTNKVLTLSGLTLLCAEGSGAALTVPACTIHLTDNTENLISNNFYDNITYTNACGISCNDFDGSMIFEGNGKLTSIGGSVEGNTYGGYSSIGISVSCNLTVNSGTIVAMGANANQPDGSKSYGISCGSQFTINGGNLTVGSLSQTNSTGLYGKGIAINGGMITASGTDSAIHVAGEMYWDSEQQKLLEKPAYMTAGEGVIVSGCKETFVSGATQTLTPLGTAPMRIGVPENLTAITTPAAITGLTNGTAKTAAALGLPATVGITTSNGNTTSAAVVWDLSSVSYDPSGTGAQTFTVPGTMTLPDGMTNSGNISLGVQISVSVEAAPILPDPQFKLTMNTTIDSVPTAIAAADNTLATPDAVKGRMQIGIDSALGTGSSIHYFDLLLMVSNDNGTTWDTATPDNFPADGIRVVIPWEKLGITYAQAQRMNFSVTHMFSSAVNGHTPGTTETPQWTVTADGLTFTLAGLSPVAIGFKTLPLVTFNANGGTCGTDSAYADQSGKLASLPTPTLSGYTFSGWYTAASGGDAITANTVFSADTTVYAQWTPEAVTPSEPAAPVSNEAAAAASTPATEDPFDSTLWAGLMGVGLLGMAAAIRMRRKEEV